MTTSKDLPEDRLCEFVARLPSETLPSPCRDRLACALLDWFTAGHAGAGTPAARRILHLASATHGNSRIAPVLGVKALHSAAVAAFANAGISHLREIDDGHRGAMMHPGIVAIPPVLALAAKRPPVPMTTAASAIVAGYEVGLRCGEALGQGHYGRFHTTATAGALASAAASGIMLGLSHDQFKNALGLAATQAAGPWQFADDGATDMKPLHASFAVRNGLSAALAAQAGFPGPSMWMTGGRGLYRTLHGDGPIEAFDGELGSPFKIEETCTKTWPVCGQIFTALDAASHLLDAVKPDPEDVETVDVRIYPQALRVASINWPAIPSQAPFSPRYCLAVLLKTGRLAASDMNGADFDPKRLIAFADRIRVTAEPSYAATFPKQRTCTVTFVLRGRGAVSETRSFRRGDPEDPVGWNELLPRFAAYAPSVPVQSASAIADWCRSFAEPGRSDPCLVPASLFHPPADPASRAGSPDTANPPRD